MLRSDTPRGSSTNWTVDKLFNRLCSCRSILQFCHVEVQSFRYQDVEQVSRPPIGTTLEGHTTAFDPN